VARDTTSRIQAAAEAILVPGEHVTGSAPCWATERRGRVPLLFLSRQQYVMALTDRRVLIFRRTRKPSPQDLVMGKRYESFTLEGVRRRRFLMQVEVRAANGNRQVFEFRPGQRDLGGELIARLTPSHATTPDATEPGTQLPDPAPFATHQADPAPSDAAPSDPDPSSEAPTETSPSEPDSTDAASTDPDPLATEFWGAK
jgi:hypothetical protein